MNTALTQKLITEGPQARNKVIIYHNYVAIGHAKVNNECGQNTEIDYNRAIGSKLW